MFNRKIKLNEKRMDELENALKHMSEQYNLLKTAMYDISKRMETVEDDIKHMLENRHG